VIITSPQKPSSSFYMAGVSSFPGEGRYLAHVDARRVRGSTGHRGVFHHHSVDLGRSRPRRGVAHRSRALPRLGECLNTAERPRVTRVTRSPAHPPATPARNSTTAAPG
jgi:hypothetical protein